MGKFGANLQSALINVVLVGALLFSFGSVYLAYHASIKAYPPTPAQRAYAEHFCVDIQHGSVESETVSAPDLFHSQGPLPRLLIRCGFGHHEFMLKELDLASLTARPR